ERGVRVRAVLRAPFADGTDEVRLCGLLGHGRQILRPGRLRSSRGPLRNPAGPMDGRLAASQTDYLRIPRSADVSASENAGRENSRSAYFMSGAAGFGMTWR